MKTKIVILVIVAAVTVSFTFVNQSKQSGDKAKHAQVSSGKYLSDKNQFN